MKRYKTSTGSVIRDLPMEIHPFPTKFKEFDLPNNLHCILYKNDKNPIVSLTMGYKIGSKDEESHKKGFAHFFEHMMFQGSQNVKKNEHFDYIMKSGGTCNAFTMQDATVYFEFLPSNSLEMGLWLESDRMMSLNISVKNMTNQKSVVIEEKKQRYDNSPYGTLLLNIFSNVYKGSNYESSVIGEVEDINSFTVEEAKKFHSSFYSPENSVLMIAGDIDYSEAEELVYKYFADINKKNSLARKYNKINSIEENLEIVVYDNIHLPLLNICYQVPKAGSDEEYIFEYFSEIIANNKSSRLYKKFVYEKKFLKSIKVVRFMLEDAGIIFIKAMINPGIDIEMIKSEIHQEINNLSVKGCTDEEFQKIKNQIEFDNTIKHLRIQNISFETIFNYLYYKDTSKINSAINKYLSISKQDVINSVNKYMIDKNNLTLVYLPINYKK